MSAPRISPPIFMAGTRNCSVLLDGGELKSLSLNEGRRFLEGLKNPLLLHAPSTLKNLGLPFDLFKNLPKRDLLELFLLARPAQSIPPTLSALCREVGVPSPTHQDEGFEAEVALKVSQALLTEIGTELAKPGSDFLHAILHMLAEGRWGWIEDITAYAPDWEKFKFSDPKRPKKSSANQPETPYSSWLEIWNHFDKWEAENLRPQPGHKPVSNKAALERLNEIKSRVAEDRPTQQEFALAASKSFAARKDVGEPTVVFAQGGTGIGKTLAYLAPSSVWAEQNQGYVWLSTYTKHLQKQLWEEAQSLNKTVSKPVITLKKGRENYLCALSMQEIIDPIILRNGTDLDYAKVPAALLLNWAKKTKDGDLFDGTLPGWFTELFPYFSLSALADSTGECLYASCPFYQSCFIEWVNRRAKQADIVIANHALTILNAAQEASLLSSQHPDATSDPAMPRHYVFDEGHLLFEACDNSFLTEFSLNSWLDIRRWILGNSKTKRRRLQGLRRRLEEIIILRPEVGEFVKEVEQLTTRLYKPSSNASATALETFFRALITHLRSKIKQGKEQLPDGECDLYPLHPDLVPTIDPLIKELRDFVICTKRLDRELSLLPGDDSFREQASPEQINKVALLSHSLKTRVIGHIEEWVHILEDAKEEQPLPKDGSLHQVNIVRAVSRSASRSYPGSKLDDIDIGIFRHFLDPMKPFATAMKPIAHGILETSATLFPPPDPDEAVISGKIDLPPEAVSRLGASYLSDDPEFYSFESPFNYAEQCRIFIVTDVPSNPDALAQAYELLFEASGGGALGLFTAISRLKHVFKRIQKPLAKVGIPLLGQHVGLMGNATLAQIFRDDVKSCLLGTDAMRDGLDVPGKSLRMIVLEKVPWARPDILHRMRRVFFSPKLPKLYDEEYARARIRQAFGRLIRRASDRGVFVMLDQRTPTRLLNAFPRGVEVKRAPLDECVKDIIDFLHTETFEEASHKG